MIKNTAAINLTYIINNKIGFIGQKFGWAEAVDV